MFRYNKERWTVYLYQGYKYHHAEVEEEEDEREKEREEEEEEQLNCNKGYASGDRIYYLRIVHHVPFPCIILQDMIALWIS